MVASLNGSSLKKVRRARKAKQFLPEQEAELEALAQVEAGNSRGAPQPAKGKKGEEQGSGARCDGTSSNFPGIPEREAVESALAKHLRHGANMGNVGLHWAF